MFIDSMIQEGVNQYKDFVHCTGHVYSVKVTVFDLLIAMHKKGECISEGQEGNEGEGRQDE